MKLLNFSLCVMFSVPALFIACTSGKNAMEKGDYDRAVYQSVNRLRSNPDHKKARSTLRESYALAINLHEDNIARSKASTDLEKWEWMIRDYQSINHIYDAIIRCPGCREVIPRPKRYDRELAEVKLKAAEKRYEMGLAALNYKNNRAKAIEAHQHFEMVKEFVPRYKDVEERINEALFYATLKVVVEPIPSPVRTLDLNHEFFVNKINEYLHHATISNYVRFYTPDEVKREKLKIVDHLIEMNFDRFSLGNVSSRVYEKEMRKDSVEVGKKGGEPVYGTVKATVRINEKSISGTGVLDFKIYDNTLNKVITQEKFPSQYVWTASWATYNGDERALDEEQKALLKRVEVSIPGPQVMFEEFTAPLYDQVINKISDFYRNY